MRTSLNIENKINMITEMRGDSVFQVLEYDSLKGGNSLELEVKLNQMKEANIKLRQVRIILEDSSVNIEKGALSYMRGPISMKNKIGGPIGLGKKLFSSKVTGESTFKPKYEGTGDIFLEPSFGHYALIELEDDEKDPAAHNVVSQDNRDGEEHKIVRMNVPFAQPGQGVRGTYFIGYARYWDVTKTMLTNMFTQNDKLLDYSKPITGMLFFIPSIDTLDAIAEGEL